MADIVECAMNKTVIDPLEELSWDECALIIARRVANPSPAVMNAIAALNQERQRRSQAARVGWDKRRPQKQRRPQTSRRR